MHPGLATLSLPTPDLHFPTPTPSTQLGLESHSPLLLRLCLLVPLLGAPTVLARNISAPRSAYASLKLLGHWWIGRVHLSLHPSYKSVCIARAVCNSL